MSRTFDELGFLSDEIDLFRAQERVRLGADFQRVEDSARAAIADLKSVRGEATPGYLVGSAFWLRSIESCQGSVLLAERGLSTSAYATLRTALECLFAAAALWKKPEVAAKIESWHHEERVKQARQMMTEGAATRLPADRFSLLQIIAAEQHPPSGWSHWEAACAADLRYEYAMMYRGLGIAGAHASPRSLDDFCTAQADGSFDLQFRPSPAPLAFLLDVIATVLTAGTQRHRQARALEG